ncbi:MAG: DNA polymerase III subunit gamma/tau C-terminal domain-containing protein, partial [Rhodanobacter sp.]
APASRAAAPSTPSAPPPARPSAEAPAPAPIPRDASGRPDWEALIERAQLRGPFSVVAQNAVLRERDGQTLVLALQPAHMGMAVEPMVSQMEDRISQALGETIRLRFVSDSHADTMQTPAARAAKARDSAQSAAEQAIEDDPLVQSLKRDFGARVVPQSVKPLGNEPGAR